jgi:predicted MPP superfamily phosphohydrolase
VLLPVHGLSPSLLVAAVPGAMGWRMVWVKTAFVIPTLIIVAAIHLYLWRRLCRDTRLPRVLWWVGTLGLACAALVYPSTLIVLFRVTTRHWWHIPIIETWLGAALYIVAVLVACDALRLCSALWRRRSQRLNGAQPQPLEPAATQSVTQAVTPDVTMVAEPELPERPELTAPRHDLVDAAQASAPAPVETRRVFMARAAASAALSAGGAATLFGTHAALWEITTPEVTIALSRLPRALDGYTIALLTDIHIGQSLRSRFLQHLVEQTNRMRPDAIAIGGDLADGRVYELSQQVAPLSKLRARDGVFYVTGNHEYYWGPAAWMQYVTELGARVLSNERVSLGDAHASGAQFDLAGVPDIWSRTQGGPVITDIDAAVAGRDPERELIVLAHQPRQVPDAARVGAGLQLSGHTHGGQLNPFGALATLPVQRYIAGLYKHEDTDTQIYVSRGSGCVGPPMRILAPAEITSIRLVRA